MSTELAALRAAYRQHLTSSVKPGTYRLYEGRLDFICRYLHIGECAQLSPSLILRYRSERQVKASSLNTDLRILKAFLNWGVTFEYLESNPLHRVKAMPEYSDVDRRALAGEEVKRLVASQRGTIWRFLIATGLRKSEFIQLVRSDLDFEKMEVKVRRSITKRGRSRIIPMPKSLVDHLRTEVNGAGSKERAFLNSRHRPWGHNGALLSALYTDVDRAGIEPVGVDLHALRKTCATRMIAAGVDIKTVQYILGHSTCQLTLDVYTEYQSRKNDDLLGAMEI